jgi:hypothetical protein
MSFWRLVAVVLCVMWLDLTFVYRAPAADGEIKHSQVNLTLYTVNTHKDAILPEMIKEEPGVRLPMYPQNPFRCFGPYCFLWESAHFDCFLYETRPELKVSCFAPSRVIENVKITELACVRASSILRNSCVLRYHVRLTLANSFASLFVAVFTALLILFTTTAIVREGLVPSVFCLFLTVVWVVYLKGHVAP